MLSDHIYDIAMKKSAYILHRLTNVCWHNPVSKSIRAHFGMFIRIYVQNPEIEIITFILESD